MTARTVGIVSLLTVLSVAAILIVWTDLEEPERAITHVGNFDVRNAPPHFDGRADGVGFTYSHWRFWFLDFWTSDGRFCVYKAEQYHAISSGEAAAYLGIPEDDLEKPFFYFVPPGLGLGVLLLAGGLMIAAVRISYRVAPGDANGHYLEALKLYRRTIRRNETEAKAAPRANETPAAQPDPFQAAIDYLIAAGIERSEAEETFTRVLADAIAPPDNRAA